MHYGPKARHRRAVVARRIDRRMKWRQRVWDWFHIDIG